MEGLGSSGKIVEVISAYPGTSLIQWCRMMSNKPTEGIFLYRYMLLQLPFVQGRRQYEEREMVDLVADISEVSQRQK